ncbi:MAG: LruC domain-containing protein [Bacteroidia bacterium]
MKKIITFTLMSLVIGLMVSLLGQAHAQTVTLNMESGNRYQDAADCWGLSSVSYSDNNGDVISGDYTARTGQFSSGSTRTVTSPWIFNPNGTLSFKHRLTSTSSASNRSMRVVIYDYTTTQYDTLYTFSSYSTTNASTVITGSVNLNRNGIFKLYFSFSGSGGSSRALIDDISIPGTYNSSPSNGCVPANTNLDADNDGVYDNQDDYPNDATLAFNNYMNSTYSTMMFEDLWPGKGDYDFNDLVIDYRVNRITNASNKIVKVYANVVLRAVGASYKNGFGFQINGLAPSKIISVNGQNLTETLFSLSTNGTESGQTYAVIPVFDNALKTIGYSGSGTGVNVETNGASIAYDTTTLTILMDTSGSGVSLSSWSASNFNPFLVINQTRGRELHKVNAVPTDKVTLSLFGTAQDKSDPSAGSYYRTVNNHPWVIETAGSISYMREKNDLTTGYLKFIDWVISGGTSYTDWYSNSGSGYRDMTKIY